MKTKHRGPGRPRKHDLPRHAPKRSGKRGPRPETTEVELSQPSLPGMEDAAIDELENVARDYVSVRDRRMALTEQEVDANALVLSMMKKHGKEVYRRDGIEIQIVAKDEKARVKIKEE